MRKYYEEFNDDYERGFRDGRRRMLEEAQESEAFETSFKNAVDKMNVVKLNLKKYQKFITKSKFNFEIEAKAYLDKDKWNQNIKKTIFNFIDRINSRLNCKAVLDRKYDNGYAININSSGGQSLRLGWSYLKCSEFIHLTDEDNYPRIFGFLDFFVFDENGEKIKEINRVFNGNNRVWNTDKNLTQFNSIEDFEIKLDELFTAIQKYLS